MKIWTMLRMATFMMTDAYEEGYTARENMVDHLKNPYDYDSQTTEWEAWDDGWFDADYTFMRDFDEDYTY